MHKHLSKFCNSETAIAIFRIVLGVIFFTHGLSKFLDTAGGIVFFNQLGLNQYLFYIMAGIELVGGLALLSGVFTRYAGLTLSLLTFVFALYAKVPPIFAQLTNIPPSITIPEPIFKFIVLILNTEVDIVLTISAMLLFFIGAGKWSMASFCKCKCHPGESKCNVCVGVGCK